MKSRKPSSSGKSGPSRSPKSSKPGASMGRGKRGGHAPRGPKNGPAPRGGGQQGAPDHSSPRGRDERASRGGQGAPARGGYQGGGSERPARGGGYQGGGSERPARGGGYQGGGSERPARGGGYQGGSERPARGGGYQGGGSERPARGGGYQGGSERPARGGGYQGGSERPARGGGYQGGSERPARGGGYQGGSERPARGGGYQGGSERPARGGGYQGGSERPARGGGYQGGSERPARGGGYQGGGSERPARGEGLQGGSERPARGGGYQGGSERQAPERPSRAGLERPGQDSFDAPFRGQEGGDNRESFQDRPRRGEPIGDQDVTERAPRPQGYRSAADRAARPNSDRAERPTPRYQSEPRVTLEAPAPAPRTATEERVWGRHTVIEHLRSETPINRIFVLTSAQGLNREFFELAQEQGIPVVRCQKDRLDFLANGGNHQGVVAQLGARAFATAKDVIEGFLAREDGLLLVLSGVQDPGNLGAILRSAEGAGVHGVLLSAQNSCGLTATVSKISAGADAHIPVARADRLERLLEPLKQQGIQIVTTLPLAEKPYYKVDFRRPTVIVLGGEGEGIDGRLARLATQSVAIPMLGKMESLNVSAATAVVLYEAVRQRLAR